jgi:hypothetical protein
MQMCLKLSVALSFIVVENKAEREAPACGWAVTEINRSWRDKVSAS